MKTIITCDDVNKFIFSIAPDPKPYHETEQVYAWGDPKTPCRGVAVAWWAGTEILRQAAKSNLNFVVSHEDPVMELGRLPLLPHRSPAPQTLSVKANRERMQLMVRHGLVVHRHHWNIDLAPWGIATTFVEEMGWSENLVHSDRCQRIVELEPVPLSELVKRLKARLKIPFVRVASPGPNHVVRRVGIAPGGSGQGWGTPAVYSAMGCDTVIVGDMIHACARMAIECGMAAVDCFHHAAEEPGLRRLADKIAAQFPMLPVKFFAESAPWRIG